MALAYGVVPGMETLSGRTRPKESPDPKGSRLIVSLLCGCLTPHQTCPFYGTISGSLALHPFSIISSLSDR
jgi:hypothetical protein